MRLAGIAVDPAARLAARLCIEPDQLANAQAAAVEQFGDAAVARFHEGVNAGGVGFKTGQLHCFIDAQGLGQRLGHLGRAHVLHRVARHQAFTAQPGVKTAPARQDQRNAAPAASTRMHLRHPAPQMRVRHVSQCHAGLARLGLQLLQVGGVQLDGAAGKPLFHADICQVADDQRVRRFRHFRHGNRRGRQARHAGVSASSAAGKASGVCKRDSAAPASSPSRSRNSVPMPL